MRGLNKDILKLAMPSILANITIPIVGMVDIAIAGHLDNLGMAATMIGGVTIGSMLFDLLYWNFGFLRAGTGGLTAQAYGRKDYHGAANILSRSIGIALIASIILLLIQWFFVDFAFLFIKSSPQVRELASTYFYMRIWAAPATLCLMAFKGWFIGMQDTISPMSTDFLVVIVNVCSSILLAFGIGHFKGLGFIGIATGTVIAQYSGLFLAIVIFLWKYSSKVLVHYKFTDALKAFRSSGTKLFFKTNSDLFVRSICFIGIYMGFTMIAARYGDVALASSAVIMKLMLFFSYFTDGFAYAGEALTGKYVGEGNNEKIKKVVKYIFIWSFSIALIFVLLNGFFSKELFKLMTSDINIIAFSRHYIIWLILVPIFGCPAFIWDGIYVGATASTELRRSAIFSVLSFLFVWFFFAWIFGVLFNPGEWYNIVAIHILLLAFFSHLFMRTVYQSIVYWLRKGSFSFMGKKK